jgi:hypothetical protein
VLKHERNRKANQPNAELDEEAAREWLIIFIWCEFVDLTNWRFFLR